MTLAKVIGRKPEAQITVYSRAAGDMPGKVGDVFGWCMEQGRSPDIVVWDYDVSLTSSHMDAMAEVAAVAEKYKAVVIAPLSAADAAVRRHFRTRKHCPPVRRSPIPAVQKASRQRLLPLPLPVRAAPGVVRRGKRIVAFQLPVVVVCGHQVGGDARTGSQSGCGP